MSEKRRRSCPKQQKETGKRKAKREEIATLSKHIKEVRCVVQTAWNRKEKYYSTGLELDIHPFPHCVIPNFIESQNFLEGLKNELLDLHFNEKSNDLYQFKQSDDLKKKEEPHISALRKVLSEDFREWLSDIIGVDLERTLDLFCAKYEYTDVLLCHDDWLEGRRIAFILYLVPSWEKSDGGTLDLFSTDEHYEPHQIEKVLVPSWNTLVFFEVSPKSYHQVSEVLSKANSRLSVGGWFHGPSLERPPPYIEPLLPRHPHNPHDREILYEWINPTYLDIDAQSNIQEEFEDLSEIMLKNFLKVDKFQKICEAVSATDIQWITKGPPNKRSYQQAEEESMPGILKQCLELFHSEAFFLLLSNFTGLKLHFLAPSEGEAEAENEGCVSSEDHRSSPLPHSQGAGQQEPNEHGVPVCRGEVRHWRHGDYILIRDTDVENTEFALDLLLFVGYKDWQVDCGGYTSYIAKDEDEELLTIHPEDNSLALVYRDKETLKFVKHINHKSLNQSHEATDRNGYWDFSFVYYE